MASLINVDAPGAYPATPSNEEPAQQTQPSSHNFIGSHVPLEGSSRAYGLESTSLGQDPTQSNKETPRSLSNDDDAHFSGHHFKDSGIYVDDSSFNREGLSESNNAQPGVMTGAFSRVGGRESAFTEGVNYIHHNTSTTQSPRDEGLPQYDNARALNTPTGISVPTNTPVETQNLDANTTATNAGGHTDKDGNKVRGGLREKSHIEHNDPYWGSIPFGAGVYNGVTGHGSKESTAHRKSSNNTDSTTTTSGGVYNGVTGHGSKSTTHKGATEDAYDAAGTNHGVYNGVTGHGSKESANHHMSEYGQNIALDDLPSQQRLFPLYNNADTTTVQKASDADTRNNDSRFKELFAGAGATAAGGYAAHKHHNRDSEKETKVAGYFGGAAAAGTGAGAYGIHKYANRDQAPEDEVEPSTMPHDTVYESIRNESATAGLQGLRKPANRDGQLLAPEDEPATSGGEILGSEPVVAGKHGLRKHPKRNDIREELSNQAGSQNIAEDHSRSLPLRHKNNMVSGDSTGVTRDTERFSSDSSHGGQYNVLSSGTPSGINLEQAHISEALY
ncbi:hypothetical protein GQX73_g2500 [Xylaria multiplex]|uniref:Uncharacterized protein n=1 Tax=Xylaria multiplex TaxID=323545 RepID=A0A7C8IU54_9PEZI|nr:hypothetical protein GQX73_g2500 [Xylaria multiplex]